MIGYILLAVLFVGANANSARLDGFDLAAYNRKQVALEAQEGSIQGSYNKYPTSNGPGHWTNEVLALPRGATGVNITNHNINNVQLYAGYKSSHSGSISYTWKDIDGDVTLHLNEAGVAFIYKRVGQESEILIPGSATPDSDYNFIVSVQRKKGATGPGHITWNYTAP